MLALDLGNGCGWNGYGWRPSVEMVKVMISEVGHWAASHPSSCPMNLVTDPESLDMKTMLPMLICVLRSC